jgi:hypothetical protein
MAIETNLNVAPYYDNFDEDKNFHKILFRPGVALQNRELLDLQNLSQQQIERFASHVFKNGTIVEGVNFEFNPKYDYVKILDTQVGGVPAAPAEYINLMAKNSSNVIAQIVNFKTGFESLDPDTNYLFLRYINSGNTFNISSFSNDEVLTIYSDNYRLFNYNITNGGQSFSNTDTAVIISPLLVKNSNVAVGGVSQTIGSNTANVYVIESNTTFGTITINGTQYSNTEGYKILKVRPIFSDLSNTLVTASKWSVSVNSSLLQGANSANVVAIIGTGASATITTDTNGVVVDYSITNSGSGYQLLPYVNVRSSTGTVSILDIQAVNYKAQVVVGGSTLTGGSTTAVGNGYAFSVTSGVIYQKGYFIQVDPQTIIVNAYSSNVNNVTVGFTTVETIVNSAVDSTLLDNSLGAPNENAPGANRLKLAPTLAVVNTSSAAGNNSFFPLVEFREGAPYKQYKLSQYNVLGQEFERRSDETNGNFVTDPFVISTSEQYNYSNNTVDIIIDPGLAYIGGKRVEIEGNTRLNLRRAVDFKTLTDQSVSFNYGNYVNVDEYVGYFDHTTGATVTLYDTARNYISTGQSTIATTGNAIGTARIRSIVYDSGLVGSAAAKYRIYLFDIRMEQGKSFTQTRSIYFTDGTNKGICDIIISDDPNSGEDIALLNESLSTGLVYGTGARSARNANNVNYQIRTTNNSVTISTTGVVTITSSDEFPYGNNAALSAVQRREIILAPKSNTTSTNTIINITTVSSNATINGTGLAAAFEVGDFVKLYSGANSAQTMFSTVKSVESSGKITLANTWTYAGVVDGIIARHFPAFVPIPLDDSRVSANLNGNAKTLTISLGNTSGLITLASSVGAHTTFTVRKVDSQELSKTINRGVLVKIRIANNVANTTGPWCLGIPDVFRLNAVYKDTSSVVNTSSTDVTRYFTVDTGQSEDYYGHSHLRIEKDTGLTLTSSDWLLVELDSFGTSTPTSAGYFSIESYVLAQNNASRATLGNTSINVMEIPSTKVSTGAIFDLRDALDFRPRVMLTANATSTLASATVNPANTINFNTHDKLFPAPDSLVEYNTSYYLTRTDRVILDKSGTIRLIEGVPSDVFTPPPLPAGSINIGTIVVPPWPSLPVGLSKNYLDFTITRTGTDLQQFTKLGQYTIAAEQSLSNEIVQPRVYTMIDIAELDRRLKSLEKYVTLCCEEMQTKNLYLASDSGGERFKNSLFVDTFEDYNNCDTSHPEFRCYIDQKEGILHPFTASINFQARFNYDDTTTANCISLIEGTVSKEPGIVTFGEAIATLEIESEFTLIDQAKQTSAISTSGQPVKFVGDIEVLPTTFKMLLEVETQVTDIIAPPPVPQPVPAVVDPTPAAAGKPKASPKPRPVTYRVGTDPKTGKPIYRTWTSGTIGQGSATDRHPTLGRLRGGIDKW